MEKELTIDEILVKNGILYANGNLHANMIASMNEYVMQQSKPLNDKIEELTLHNSNSEARLRSWDKMYKKLLEEQRETISRVINLEKINEELEDRIYFYENPEE